MLSTHIATLLSGHGCMVVIPHIAMLLSGQGCMVVIPLMLLSNSQSEPQSNRPDIRPRLHGCNPTHAAWQQPQRATKQQARSNAFEGGFSCSGADDRIGAESAGSAGADSLGRDCQLCPCQQLSCSTGDRSVLDNPYFGLDMKHDPNERMNEYIIPTSHIKAD